MGLLIVFLMLVLLCIVIIKLLPRTFRFFDRKYTPEEIRKKRPRLITTLAILSLLGAISSIIAIESPINVRKLRKNLNWQETLIKEGEAEYKGNVFNWEDYSPKRKAGVLYSIRCIQAQIKYRAFLVLSYGLSALLGVILFVGFLGLRPWLLKLFVISVIVRFVLMIPIYLLMFPAESELLVRAVIGIVFNIFYWVAQILVIYYLMKPKVRELCQSA